MYDTRMTTNLKPGVEHVRLAELRFEVCGTCEDHARDVGLVVGDEHLHGRLGHFPDVVVPLLHAETGETEGGLTTTTVLLGQVYRELVQDVAGVALKGPKQGAVTVHHDETEPEAKRIH